MSLLDALLLEPTPLKTPTANAFFVALRNDGVVGSGTLDDPWDGSTIRYPQAAATFDWLNLTDEILIWYFVDPTVALIELLDTPPADLVIDVTTPAAHGLASGDVVRFGNVAPADAAEHFDHDLFVVVTSPTTFQVTIPTPPFGVVPLSAMTVGRVDFRMDRVLRDFFPPNSTLHIGPGVFETRGCFTGWINAQGNRERYYRAQTGQKILGAGIEITILKLVVAELPNPGRVYFALGAQHFNDEADNSEVSDLTVDCNMAEHPYGHPYGAVAKAAINLVGSHVRIRRVRAIGFGTQTIQCECFAITMGGSHPLLDEKVNCVSDECLVELPHPDNVRETTCLGIGGSLAAYHRGGVIRNCVLDGRYQGKYTSHYIRIRGQSMDDFKDVSGQGNPPAPANTWRVTTVAPHNLALIANKRNVVISGIWAPAHPAASPYLNGDFPVHRIVSATEFEFVARGAQAGSIDWWNSGKVGVQLHGPGAGSGVGGVIERNRVYHVWLGANHDTWSMKDALYVLNFYANVYAGPFHSLGGESGPQNGSAISHDGGIARFTSFAPHNLEPDDEVTIKDALAPNHAGELTTENPYNGTAAVIDVLDAHTFTYAAAGLTSADPNAIAAPLFRIKTGDVWGPWRLGVSVARVSADPPIALFTAVADYGVAVDDYLEVSAVAVNGDANTPYNGQYSGTSLYKVAAVEGLTFTYQMSADPGVEVPSYAPWFSPQGSATRIAGTSLVRDGNLASFTASYFHGLLPGQAVYVQEALVLGTTVNAFNGYFVVENVPVSPHINGKPTSFTYRMTTTPASDAAGNPIWSEYWRVRQLALERNIIEVIPEGAAFPAHTATYGAIYPRVYRGIIARENAVRAYGAVSSGLAHAGGFVGCERAVVQNNIFSLARSDGKILWDIGADSPSYFNNQRLSGARVSGFSEDKQRPRDELATRIEDSILMAL